MASLRIAVPGALGQLGRELCRQLGAEAVPLDLPELDVTRPECVRRALSEQLADVVLNCAAYTDVDRAEQEDELCFRVNAEAVRHLAEWCRDQGRSLAQISTDYVFGGDTARRTPYKEDDIPAPQGVYARSKLRGEQQARIAPRHLVIRTCGLYGLSPRKNNFVEAMLGLGGERKSLSVVDDHYCTPSYVVDVARAALFLVRSGCTGTYHVTNAGMTTWCRFAREIFRQSGMDVGVEPITSEQYGAAAPRPRYSVLDVSKYQDLGGPELPEWREALARYLIARRGV